MLELRSFANLGRFANDWLNANYHFSFSGYHDPNRDGWGSLLVWNDDTIRAKSGFPPHPHRDMEIVTYVRKGAVTHEDSLGNRGRTGAGDVQVMSAGTGIRHAEYNLEDEATTLFQIWILPAEGGVRPRWEMRKFPKADRGGKFVPLASGRAGHEGAAIIHQDAAVLGATLKSGDEVAFDVAPGRFVYLVPATGRIAVNGIEGGARDGFAARDLDRLTIKAIEESEIVLADVPPLR